MLPSFSQDLDLLGSRWASGTASLLAYMDGLASMLLRQFNCSAVALWRIHGEHGERTMCCLAQYRASGERVPGSGALSEARFESYFAVLDARGVFVCADTREARVFALSDDPHRWPDSPRAFVDAVVSVNGRPFGVLTCYHNSGARHWALEDVTNLRRMGARVALHVSRLTPSMFEADCCRQVHHLDE